MKLECINVVKNRETTLKVATLDDLLSMDKSDHTGYWFRWYARDEEGNTTNFQSLSITLAYEPTRRCKVVDRIHCTMDSKGSVYIVVGTDERILTTECRPSGTFYEGDKVEGEMVLTEEEYFQDSCYEGKFIKIVEAQATYKELFKFISTYI